MLIFEGLLVNVLVLAVSLLVLSRASHLTIAFAVRMSEATGFGKTTIGFVLTAFATSLPELLVCVFAVSGAGSVGLAVGNILGSNIVNVCLVLGLCMIIISRMKSAKPYCSEFSACVAKEEIGGLHFGLFVASLIPLFFIYVRQVGQLVGLALVGLFSLNLFQMFRARVSVKEDVSDRERLRVRRYGLFVVVGVVGVIASAYFLVDSASAIALGLGVPSVTVGATVVAFGTSIPELATSVEATRQGHLDLALGNIIGSGFLNLTLVLGFPLALSPFAFDAAAFSNLALFSVLANVMLWYFMSMDRVGRREGAILVSLYVLFLATSLSETQVYAT